MMSTEFNFKYYRYLNDSGPELDVQSYQFMSGIANSIYMGCSKLATQCGQRAGDTLQSYQSIMQNVYSPLKVLVAGEFKTGKSTFINALLGRELLKTEVIPSTALITYICYGDREGVSVLFNDGRTMEVALSELGELTSENGVRYENLRPNIKAVYVFLPIPFLKHITLIDSPGINVRIKRHEEVSHSVWDEVDCVLWLMAVTQAGKASELEEIKKLPKHLKPFIIINRIDMIDEDFTDINKALNQIKLRINDLCTGSVGVSSYLALEASKSGDANMYQESRFGDFTSWFHSEVVAKWVQLKVNAIWTNLKVRKANFFVTDVADEMKKSDTLQKWIQQNSNIKKWENLVELYQQRNAFLKDIDDCKEFSAFADIGKLLNDGDFIKICRLMENPVKILDCLKNENMLVEALKNKQVAELEYLYNTACYYYYQFYH